MDATLQQQKINKMVNRIIIIPPFRGCILSKRFQMNKPPIINIYTINHPKNTDSFREKEKFKQKRT